MFWGAIYRAKYPPTYFIHTQTKEREMKRNHIAIAGILASVLVTMDAAWADTATVIASQAYVDAKVGTKQNKLNAGAGGNVTVDNTSTTAASRAITGITATGDGTVTFTTQPISVDTPAASTYIIDNATSAKSISSNDTDKAPSVRAVKNMVRASNATGGAVRATASASDVLVPTEKAVATALDGKLNSDLVNSDTNAIVDGHAEKIPTNNAVQKGVLYMKGDGIARRSTAADLDTITAEQSWTTAAGADNSIKAIRDGKLMDNYVPTMAAVEARVKAAENLIPDAPSTITTNALAAATADNSKLPTVAAVKGIVKTGTTTNTTDLTTRNSSTNVITSTGSDTAVPTTALLVDVLQTLDQTSYGTDETGTKPVTSVTQVDGKIIPVRGTITTAGIANGTIVNADISDTAAIAYTKMNGTLKDVNSTSADATCTAASPCVLTYYKIGSNVYYKWTNLIETDGVTALPAS